MFGNNASAQCRLFSFSLNCKGGNYLLRKWRPSIGAIVLARIEQGRTAQKDLIGWLNEALTRPDDRALFDLSQDAANLGTVLQPVANANQPNPSGVFQLTPAKSGSD